MRYKEREFTSTTFNLFILLIFCLPILAITHNALTTLSRFADYGHDKISMVLNHVTLNLPLYAVISTSILVCSWFHTCQLRRQKHLGKEWKALLRHWQKTVAQKTLENAALLQRYEGVKKTISETVTPCGELIFNADDSISLQHIYCKDYRRQEKTIADLKKRLFAMQKENFKLRHKAPLIVATPEYLATIKSQEIFERDGRLELAAAEAICRSKEIRHLRADLQASKNSNKTLKKIEHDIKRQLSLLSAKNKVLEASQVSNARATIEKLECELQKNKAALIDSNKEFNELMDRYSDVVSDRNDLQSQSAAGIESQSALERQVLELQRALKVRASEVELAKQSAKDGVESAKMENRGAIAGLRDEIAALKASLQKTTEDNFRAIADDQARQAALDEIKHQYTKEIAAKDKLQATLDETRQQYSEEIAAQVSEIKALRASIITIPDVQSSAEYQRVLARGQNLEQEHDQLKAEVADLNAALQHAPSAQAIQLAFDNYAQLKTSYASEIARVAVMTKQIESKEQVIANKDQTVADKDGEIATMAKELARRDTRIEGLLETKPLVDGSGAESGLLEGRLIYRDTQIASLNETIQQLTKRLRNARRGKSAATEETDPADTTSELVADVRDHFKVLTATSKELEDWLNSTNIGTPDQPALVRIQQHFDELSIMAFAAYSTSEMLDEKNVALTYPGTGALFPDLKSRVGSLADEYIRLRLYIKNHHVAVPALDPPNRPTPIYPELEALDHFSEVLEAEKTQILNELNHTLDVCNISSNKFSLTARAEYAFLNSKDASEVLQFLHNENLVSDNVPPTLIDQVKFLAQEHNRHREGGAYFHARFFEIDEELKKRYGKRNPENQTDTPLSRVKKLMTLPQNRKGQCREW